MLSFRCSADFKILLEFNRGRICHFRVNKVFSDLESNIARLLTIADCIGDQERKVHHNYSI